jgi:hypothetical protein
LQINASVSWTKTSNHHTKHGSRQWARGEVANIWKLERLLEESDGSEESWQQLVSDVERYPILNNRQSLDATAEMTDMDDDEDKDLSEGPQLQHQQQQQQQQQQITTVPFVQDRLSGWMLRDLSCMTQGGLEVESEPDRDV